MRSSGMKVFRRQVSNQHFYQRQDSGTPSSRSSRRYRKVLQISSSYR